MVTVICSGLNFHIEYKCEFVKCAFSCTDFQGVEIGFFVSEKCLSKCFRVSFS